MPQQLEDRRTHTEKCVQNSVWVDYYTDPLCSWSWGLEPELRRLRYEFGPAISVRYRMGGLLPNWQRFSDDFNSLSRPAQFGPQWMQVSQTTGMPLAANIWITDPPESSFPACQLVKAAQSQSLQAGEAVLRALREALMIGGKNIAKVTTLRQVSLETSLRFPEIGLDFEQLWVDFHSPTIREAFRSDLKEASYNGFDRFPALLVRGENSQGVVAVGHRPYRLLLELVRRVAPNIRQIRKPTAESYAAYWQRLTSAELATALDISKDEARVRFEHAISTIQLDAQQIQLLD